MNVHEVALSARIKLNEEEALIYQKNLNLLIPWFNKMLELEALKNCDLKPIYNLRNGKMIMSKDEVSKNATVETVLSNVPNKKGNLILVPKVI